MVETVLHFFKIHREVIFGNSAIIVQNMFRITPKSFNAVNMIFAFVGKRLAVVQPMVFAQPLQGVVAPEGVGVIDRSFSGMLSDMTHQLFSGHLFHHLGIHPAVAFQKPKYNAFAGRSTASLAFAPAAKVGLINLNLAFQFTRLKFGYMVDRFTQMLIDASHHLIIKAEVACHTIGRLLLVEASDNTNLFAQAFERLLFSTRFISAPDVPALRFRHLERTEEDALSNP